MSPSRGPFSRSTEQRLHRVNLDCMRISKSLLADVFSFGGPVVSQTFWFCEMSSDTNGAAADKENSSLACASRSSQHLHYSGNVDIIQKSAGKTPLGTSSAPPANAASVGANSSRNAGMAFQVKCTLSFSFSYKVLSIPFHRSSFERLRTSKHQVGP